MNAYEEPVKYRTHPTGRDVSTVDSVALVGIETLRVGTCHRG